MGKHYRNKAPKLTGEKINLAKHFAKPNVHHTFARASTKKRNINKNIKTKDT